MVEKKGSRTALLGWSLQAIEAIDKMKRPYVVVGPPEFKDFADTNGIPFIPWQFDLSIERSDELCEKLNEFNTKVTVPIYEETVEWAGILNAKLRNNPRLYKKSLLLRDKGLMKRRAQLAGIRVGIFEEAYSKDDIYWFFKRVNEALLKLDGEVNEPIHVKPFDKAGTVGHHMIRDPRDVDKINDSEFPLLMESHLEGQEFSCEAFIHNGKVRFLNITEYVELGHSNFIPASPSLEKWRPQITVAIEKLVAAFEIEYGIIHPEYFVTPDGTLYFGEVAARVPGGHIFELIEKAYGFSPFQAQVLCSDPDTTEEELKAFFPKEVVSAQGHAGSLMVYPNVKSINKLNLPEELKTHSYFDKHDMFIPVTSKVAERVGFGNHYGTIFFFGKDSEEIRSLMKKYENYDFYL
ncbi:ATP-grasp domain-containing protein [Neobacillus pocheonensis]|uniref:ATP-grasp domain-containing protein n=1 Tax=Neobacillus pocheonensis TaxID=363869 RepID=UPI003D2708E8